jgi:predicted deacylase
MISILRLWAYLTGQKLVALKDHDGEVTIVPAYKTPFGYVAKRYWPMSILDVLLNEDGTVEGGSYVRFWKDV